MAVAIVGSFAETNETSAGSTVAVTLNWDHTVTNGGIIIGVVARVDEGGSDTFTSMVINGNTITDYAEVGEASSKFARLYFVTASDLPGSSGNVTATATFGQSENWRYIGAVQVQEMGQTTPWNQSDVDQDTDTTIDLTIPNDGGTDELCIAVAHDSQAAGLTASVGTLLGSGGTGDGRSAAMAYKLGEADNNTAISFSAGSSTYGVGVGVALNYDAGAASSGDTATVTWTDNEGGQYQFRVYRKRTTDAQYSWIADTAAGDTSFVDEWLTQSTEYDYRVTCYDGTLESGYDEASTTTSVVRLVSGSFL